MSTSPTNLVLTGTTQPTMAINRPPRMVLTSVNQLIALVRSTPELAIAIPRLARINSMEPSTAPKKSCNCGSAQNFTTPDVNKQVTENIMSSLGPTDFQVIKQVLGLTELCYYQRNQTLNKLELICT